jgi:hypothetical protein
MPYNTDLEQKIDRLLERPERFEKKKMFGGVCYLLRGNMALGIHKQSLIIRTSPEQAAEMLENGPARPFDITGRPMKGWLMFSPDKISSDQHLRELLDISLSFVHSLPDK